MKSNTPICIIGGYDSLSNSYFNELKRKYEGVYFINLSHSIDNRSDLYNFRIYQLKKILELLKNKSISEIIFLGKIKRPNLEDFKNDGIVEKYIPILLEAYKKGDGAVLDTVISIFKQQNFKIVSPFKYSSNFRINNDNLVKNYKSNENIDIKKSTDLLTEISKFDNAQSAVCINGYIMAIEAAEGTDLMLKRVYDIRKESNQLKNKAGFLTKIPKKNQSKLVDLPVIGPKTLKLVNKAKLKGIAIDLKNTIIYKKEEVLHLINHYSLEIHDIS